MTKLYIADTFAFLILAVVWSTKTWADNLIKIILFALTILHIWGAK